MPARTLLDEVMTRRLIALAPALLAACAPLSPMPVPDTALPAQYAQAASQDSRASVADRPGWRDYFADAQLQGLIAQALSHNHDRRQALARLEEARALAGLQEAQRWPVLAAQAQGQRSRVPADLNLTRRPLLGEQFQLGLGLASWELDLWGRLAQLDEAARQAYLANAATLQAVELDL